MGQCQNVGIKLCTLYYVFAIPPFRREKQSHSDGMMAFASSACILNSAQTYGGLAKTFIIIFLQHPSGLCVKVFYKFHKKSKL